MTLRYLAVTIIIATCTLSFGQNDPVIMSINDKEITKSEFLQIYLKNNSDPKYDKVSLDEYMELFKRFKLKVAEAEALKYDTIPKLKNELAGYRKQLALPYLIDSIQNKSLIAQAYERTKTERRASHILITLKKDASPEDTLSAYNRLIEMKNRIEGGEDFAMVASGSRGSDDPSAASNGGDLGFFNAFQMLYPFEEAAYTTAVGEISDPVRTKYGYHIVKVTDKRLARGTIETAHIMVATGSKATEQKIIDAETKISEIYALLEKGENFEEMVIKFSDDPSSNKKDGKLPTFGTGTTTRMVPAFEDAAFSLKNDGDYSKPIRTDYGYHIVKRISWENVLPFNEMEKELESKVTKDVRSKTTQNSFVEKLKKEYNFKLKKSGLAWFKDNLDSTFFKGKFDFNQHKLDQEIFSMDGKKFTQKEFADHLIFQYRAYARKSLSEAIDLSYQDWVKKAILEYEESKLPSKFPAYKALITEYHDGILLYEIMSDIVWNKAMRDTSGLENYFESNKKKYTWGKRVDADIYECYAESDAKKAYEMLKNDTITSELVVEEINGKSELKIRHRKGKFEIDKTSYLKNVNLEEGLNSPFKVDNKYFVLNVNEILEPGQKKFSESKGAATSDYQSYLEEEWLKKLSKKHVIKVYTEELYSIGQ